MALDNRRKRTNDRCMFFDSHAHLDSADFEGEIDVVLARAREAGITHIVTIGASDGFESNERALAVAERTTDVYATVGIHPHDARIVDDECLERVRSLTRHSRVVAIGETGLDYHYDHSPREKQRDVFRAFLRMARDARLPAVIHTRSAEEDTIAILEDEARGKVEGVIHCFTGTEKLASAAIDLGFYISFSGVLTFKNADALRAIARSLPRDRVLVETDCPFLAPVPFRGKRNEPAHVIRMADTLAGLWGESLDSVKRLTGANAARLFRIDP